MAEDQWEPTTILVIGKAEMLRAFHAEHALSDGFIAYLLKRTVRIEEDLMDQLFNSTEKRLARYGRHLDHETRVPKISQQTLAGDDWHDSDSCQLFHK